MGDHHYQKKIVFQENHIKIMKVALVRVVIIYVCLQTTPNCCLFQAMAIIRQKPAYISAHEFTLQLAQQFQRDEQNWKQKARELEGELLRMRQELVRCRLQEISDTGAHKKG